MKIKYMSNLESKFRACHGLAKGVLMNVRDMHYLAIQMSRMF